jgi:hypothetical protein
MVYNAKGCRYNGLVSSAGDRQLGDEPAPRARRHYIVS